MTTRTARHQHAPEATTPRVRRPRRTTLGETWHLPVYREWQSGQRARLGL